jgi:hypothetical protein
MPSDRNCLRRPTFRSPMCLTDNHTFRLSPSELTTFTACRHVARPDGP